MAAAKAADPAAQSLDDAFAGAMGATAKPKGEPPPPPDTDADAPHGRGPDGEALAPYGLTKEGKPRKTAAGRRPKEDQPRVTEPGPATSAAAVPGAAAPAAHDYTMALSEFGDAVWFGISALGKGGSALPFVGRYIPERKLAAEAGAFRAYKPQLVRAVNLAAQHNTRAARFAASVEQGEITWVMMCGFMIMPFLTMSAAIWKGDKALAEIDPELTVAKLAESNDAKLDKYLSQISEQMELLAAAAEAEALAELAEQNPEAAELAAQMAAANQAGIL